MLLYMTDLLYSDLYMEFGEMFKYRCGCGGIFNATNPSYVKLHEKSIRHRIFLDQQDYMKNDKNIYIIDNPNYTKNKIY